MTTCVAWAVTRALLGGGDAYSYIHVLPDEFLLNSTVMTTDFKRNSSDRTRIYEYSPTHPPINALVTALSVAIVNREEGLEAGGVSDNRGGWTATRKASWVTSY